MSLTATGSRLSHEIDNQRNANHDYGQGIKQPLHPAPLFFFSLGRFHPPEGTKPDAPRQPNTPLSATPVARRLCTPQVSLALPRPPCQLHRVKSAQTPAPQHWLVKSEPATYAWADFVRDGTTAWTGVRNYAARLHLRAMQTGDRVLVYESVSTRAVRGIATVSRTAFPDDTADEPGWVAVQLDVVGALAHAVSLDQIKADPALANMTLLRNSRLSVQPVTAAEFARVVRLGARG